MAGKPTKKVTNKTEKAKMGRPKKIIDQAQFEAMCQIQCTQEEVCHVLGITDKTLTKWCRETYDCTFSEVYKKKSDYGKMSIRRMQFKLAERNSAMAIWLGKQYLGQKDKIEYNGNETKEINANITNIANLINKPQEVRTLESLEKEMEETE